MKVLKVTFTILCLIHVNFFLSQKQKIDEELKFSFSKDGFNDYNSIIKIDSNKYLKNNKGGAAIYLKTGDHLSIEKQFYLSSDAKLMCVSNKNIELIDWSSTYYSFNKDNHNLNFNIQLDFEPLQITNINNTTIIFSEYFVFVYENGSLTNKIKLGSKFLQFIQQKEHIDVVTEKYKWKDILGLKEKLVNEFDLTMFEKNTRFSNVYTNNLKTEIYFLDKKLNLNNSFDLNNCIKSQYLNHTILLLSKKNELLVYNGKNKDWKIDSIIDFTVLDDSIVYCLGARKLLKINIYDSNFLATEVLPKIINPRQILIQDGSLLITYKDNSFMLKNEKDSNWISVNNEYLIRTNLSLFGDTVLYSGDNLLIGLDLKKCNSKFYNEYHTFSKTISNKYMKLGGSSGEYFCNEKIPYEFLKSKSNNKKWILDKGFIYDEFFSLYFVNKKLVVLNQEGEEIWDEIDFHQKLNDSTFLFKRDDRIVCKNKLSDNSINQNEIVERCGINETDNLIFSFKKNQNLFLLFDNYQFVNWNLDKNTVSNIDYNFYDISDHVNIDDSIVILSTWEGHLIEFNTLSKQYKEIYRHLSPIMTIDLNNQNKSIFFLDFDGTLNYFSLDNHSVQFKVNYYENIGIIATDPHKRFDANNKYINELKFYCGKEIIELSQIKDSLWVPGLMEKIMIGQELLINNRKAPKLSDLNICGLTPLILPLERGINKEYRYKIIPRRGGLGKTEIYINGNLTFSFYPNELELNNDNSYHLNLTMDSLEPYLTTNDSDSSNPVVVKAKVKNANIYSRGIRFDVPVKNNGELPRFFGVFIGVNDYGNAKKESSYIRFDNLDYASKDASDLSLAVEASARALFKDSTFIYRLSNDSLQDYHPTKENLTQVFEDIGKKAKANDVLFVFFAGHGSIDEKDDKKEIKFMLEKADKRNLASSGFGVADLSNWCHPKKLKAQKRVFVFDACHSGQFVNEQMAMAQGGRGDDEESVRIRQLDKLKDKNGMMILAAAADDQYAYEDVTLDQGVLTYHLLDAMQSGDTTLTVNKWFAQTITSVEEYASRNGQNQSPNSFGSGRFEIGNITKDVLAKIEIVPPKIRIGKCVFLDPTGEAEAKYPTLIQSINEALIEMNGKGENFVFSSFSDKTYSAKGTYYFRKNKLMLRYKIYYDNKEITNLKAVVLNPFKNKSEDEIAFEVLDSIKERIDIHLNLLKLHKK